MQTLETRDRPDLVSSNRQSLCPRSRAGPRETTDTLSLSRSLRLSLVMTFPVVLLEEFQIEEAKEERQTSISFGRGRRRRYEWCQELVVGVLCKNYHL